MYNVIRKTLTLGRDFRTPHSIQESGRRRRQSQQTLADFELVVNVTFSCFGCEGRLFGKTNYTPNLDCLCPKDGDQYGVDEEGIISPLNEVIRNQRSTGIAQSIADIIEIQEVPCSSIAKSFSTVVTMEYLLKDNETTPTAADLAILEDQFVAGYNGIARRNCDPWFRWLLPCENAPDAAFGYSYPYCIII